MGALWGLPDFGAPQDSRTIEVCASFEPGPYLVWPTALDVAMLGPGRPDFQIVLVRSSGTGPDSGALDIGIERKQDIDGALALVRRRDPRATVAMVPFQSGFIRLDAGGDPLSVPAELAQPSPLGWGGLDATRWNLPLTAESAQLLKAGLTSTLIMTARAEVEVLGVAPRVDTVAVFDPAAILNALVPPGAASRRIARTTLNQFFLDARANIPSLRLEGHASPDRDAFAQAMAGRVRMAYGTFVPSPAGAGSSYLELASAASGTVRWNLAEPTAVLRPSVFMLDPFSAARALVASSGVGALYREVTTSPLALGFFDVDVQAFLPSPRLGVLDLGVVITVPAQPPFQPQAVSQTIPFRTPVDRGVAHLRVPPLSTLTYAARTYVELLEGSGSRRLEATLTADGGSTLRVQPKDFAVDLIDVSADPALLGVASLDGSLAYTSQRGVAVSTAFALTAAQRRVSVALPRDAAAATISVEARSTVVAQDGTTLQIGPLPASPLHVTLGSLREYGDHQIDVTATFPDGAPGPLQIDLRADSDADDTAHVSTVVLTRQNPTATWTYLASSPFRSGYRWRLHPDGPWSAAMPHDAMLHVTAAAAAGPRTWDIGGVHLFVQPGDPTGWVRYVPGEPTPQVDDRGRPTLLLIDTGSVGILSLGTRLDLTDVQRNDIELALLPHLDGVDRILFQPAAFTAGPVTLALADGAGAADVLASTSSMNAPPFNATFSVQVRGEQRTRMLAALTGTPQVLTVSYPLVLAPEVAATFTPPSATLVRTSDVAAWIAGDPGTAHIQKVGG